MGAILQPGYLRWDGTKYVLDQDVEIVGPEGDAGPTGGQGPPGVPGIGVGATAVGDLNGTYPNPISVVGLTGVSGVVSFGSTINNPTITQTTTVSATGKPMTVRGQNAATTGGNVNLQSGTGTTAGLVQFLVGNSIAGYFDANSILRISSNSNGTLSWLGATAPTANVTSLYSYTSSVNNQAVFATGSSAGQATVDVISTAIAPSGGRLVASGPTDSTTGWATNFILEQIGSGSSALLFSKANNVGGSRGTLARLYQSGALAMGDAATNNTSTTAQAGLVGSLLNIGSATSGSLTTTTNQAVLYNNAGTLNVQGNLAVNLIASTSNCATATTTKFSTNLGRRVKVTNITSGPYTVLTTDEIVSVGTLSAVLTITLPSSPTTGDTYNIKDANGSAAAFNITVQGNGNNIDVGATFVLTANYSSITVVYNGSKWIIV